MALSDLLSNGTVPVGSAVTDVTKQTVLPDWYTNYAMDILSGQKAVSNLAYTPYQAPRVANFTDAQRAGFNATAGAAGAYQPGLNAATGTVNGAAHNPTGASVSQPAFNVAGQMVNSAVASGGGLAAAQPYLGNAARAATDVSAYMNPYTEQVVNRIADLGVRNLNEKIMPGIEGRYIAAGQLGYAPRNGVGTPTGMMTDTARAIRDTSDDILGQQSAALQAGYGSAQNVMQNDLSRQAGLASTAGGLGTAQQSAALTGAGQMANLGTSAASIASNDTSNMLAAGKSQAELAGLAQQYGLTGAGALTDIGKQQQGLNQQNLDVAYQDFLRQQGYPQEQINNLLNTFKGVQVGVPSATTEAGIVPSSTNSNYQPSTASSIASGLTGLAGLLTALK